MGNVWDLFMGRTTTKHGYLMVHNLVHPTPGHDPFVTIQMNRRIGLACFTWDALRTMPGWRFMALAFPTIVATKVPCRPLSTCTFKAWRKVPTRFLIKTLVRLEFGRWLRLHSFPTEPGQGPVQVQGKADQAELALPLKSVPSLGSDFKNFVWSTSQTIAWRRTSWISCWRFEGGLGGLSDACYRLAFVPRSKVELSIKLSGGWS